MYTIKRRDFIILSIAATTTVPAATYAADTFPSRPIRLIVPYPPGGGTDIVGRVLGEKLSANLGQPIVVDNRGGAGGVLGTEIVAKAVPDGYTLLLVPTSHVINPSEAAKANPKAIGNYGSAGVGTVFHLTGQLFNQLSGLSLQHVPYRGGGPTVTALLAGEIPLAFETMLSLQPHVRAGSLRALAITSPRRSVTMPEIPTTVDAGFPDLVAENSYALFAPARTPVPILMRLQDAAVAALALPDVRDRLREQGAEVVGNSSAELAAYVATEIPKWAALARQADVKSE